MIKKEIRKKIEENIDERYQKFQASLVPNIHTIEGVRVPILRKIAKQLVTSADIDIYLEDPLLTTYEEKTIYGLMLGYQKLSTQALQKYLKIFIPSIDNWATCDIVASNLKIVSQKQKELYPFFQKYLHSKKEFEVRFAVVIFMMYYVKDSYEDILVEITKVKHSGYYVKMAIAWLLSTGYLVDSKKTYDYLKDTCCDREIQKYAIAKICDSYRVSQKEKEAFKQLRNMI